MVNRQLDMDLMGAKYGGHTIRRPYIIERAYMRLFDEQSFGQDNDNDIVEVEKENNPS